MTSPNTSGVAVGAARQLLWSMLGAPSPWDAHRAESRTLVELGAGPDAAEGVASFLETRNAVFPVVSIVLGLVLLSEETLASGVGDASLWPVAMAAFGTHSRMLPLGVVGSSPA